MNKIKNKNFNHYGLIFLLVVFLIFILINCISLLLKDKSGNLKFYGKNEVELLAKLTITDLSAKSIDVKKIEKGIIGYTDFTIELSESSKEKVKYEIYLFDVTSSNVFKYNYVKLYLTDGNDMGISKFTGNKSLSYSDLRVLLNQPEKRVLFSGVISPGEKQNFKLRMWLSDTYVIDDYERKFTGKLSVNVIS